MPLQQSFQPRRSTKGQVLALNLASTYIAQLVELKVALQLGNYIVGRIETISPILCFSPLSRAKAGVQIVLVPQCLRDRQG